MKIILKNIDHVDIDKVVKWKSDPELSKQIMSQFKVINKTEALGWLDKNSADPNQRLNGIYGITNDNSNIFLGITRLMYIDFKSKNTEFGIYIGEKKFQGNGIGSKALNLTIRQAFDELGLFKIYLKVNSNNIKAINLYKKFGFITEGVLKEHYFEDNKFQDISYMSLFNK